MEFSHCWCKMAQLLTVSCKIKHTLPIQPRNPTLTSTSKRNENLYPHKNLYMIIYLCSAKSLQSFPTLCDPIDGSPPGSPVPGILQARTLEWVAISFSNASKWKVKVKSLSRVWLLATPWTAAYQAPLSTGLSRQECWSGVPLPSPWLSMVTWFLISKKLETTQMFMNW